MNWIALFTSFEGRIGRKQFWIGMIALGVIEAIATLLQPDERIAAVIDLVILYPEFAVCAKRGHDRNIPTWVVGAFFALSVLLDLLILAGMARPADSTGANPYLTFLLILPMSIFALILLIDLGFRRGTVGPNRFGPDPLAATAEPML